MFRHNREKVRVAMSGGVDSSVAAALLLQQGCEVTGVTMRIWDEDRIPDYNVKIKHYSCFGPEAAQVTPIAADQVRVEFSVPQPAITTGQSVVFYRDDDVLGGGVIDG